MSDPPTNADRFLELVGAVCSKCASADDFVELNSILLADEVLRRHYLSYCRMHVALRLDLRAHRAAHRVCQQVGTETVAHIQSESDVIRIRVQAPSAPPVSLLSTALHTPFSYLSSGWPVAYLVATVIFAIGALIGSFTYVSQPVQVAKQSFSLPSPLSPLPSVVGQITGTVDCKWNGAGSHSSKVCLGDRYDLASGLVEITYHTGAKVILQGPATYVVDAKNGGFINIGRLTGIVEVANAKGFTLRTPTAIVTDLGTEFGVEVDKEGSTTSHVFRGAVDLRPIHRDKNADAAGIILRANESAQTERDSGADHSITVHRVAVNSDVFVRRLEKPSSSVDVLAWFRMGEDEPNARVGDPAGKEIHTHNKTRVHLDRYGSPTYSADTQAPGSTLAMTFHGENGGECFRDSRFPFIPNDYFILEAWVRPHKVSAEIQTIVASRQGYLNGYSLAIIDGRWHFVFESVEICDSGVACNIGQWTHLALVCERGKAQLWINGRPVGRVLDAIPNMPDGPFTIGGDVSYPERVFNGEIDEVRLSTFIGPFRPEMLLPRKADPSK